MSKNIKQHHVTEIRKCAADPSYFFNKYVKIQHPLKGAIPFQTYEFQDDAVRQFIDNRFNIVLKARQLGLSTVTAAYAVWLAMFYQNQNILVIATKLSTAKNFIKKCKFIIKNLPDWLMLQEIESETVQSIETNKGSSIKAVPTSADAGRSEALSLLIVDEAAFVDNFDELWKGLYPTLSTGGRAILISSPNGTGNLFYRLYRGAEEKTNEFNPIKLPWTVHPERDQEWFERETRNMTKKDIAQEHECDFAASGDTFLDNSVLEWIRTCVSAPAKRVGFDRNIWIWKDPVKDHKYIIPADISRGDGPDFSAFHVIDATEGEVVVEYKGKLPPDRMAELLNEIGLLYNTALLIPEVNNVGYATVQKLCELKYPLIYNNKQKTLDVWSAMMMKPGDLRRPSGDLGFKTESNTRNVILTKLEEMLRNKTIKICSDRLYNELKTFVWMTNNKAAASKGYNDDLVMSLAIGLWVVDTDQIGGLSEEHGKALLDSIQSQSVKLDDIISTEATRNEHEVLIPVPSNDKFNGKKIVPQMVSKKWNWLLS